MHACAIHMLLKRLGVYSFSVKMQHAPYTTVKACARCFARMVLHNSSLHVGSYDPVLPVAVPNGRGVWV